MSSTWYDRESMPDINPDTLNDRHRGMNSFGVQQEPSGIAHVPQISNTTKSFEIPAKVRLPLSEHVQNVAAIQKTYLSQLERLQSVETSLLDITEATNVHLERACSAISTFDGIVPSDVTPNASDMQDTNLDTVDDFATKLRNIVGTSISQLAQKYKDASHFIKAQAATELACQIMNIDFGKQQPETLKPKPSKGEEDKEKKAWNTLTADQLLEVSIVLPYLQLSDFRLALNCIRSAEPQLKQHNDTDLEAKVPYELNAKTNFYLYQFLQIAHKDKKVDWKGGSCAIISNLPTDVTETQLLQFFETVIGPGRKACLAVDGQERSMGMGAIVFKEADAAVRAESECVELRVGDRLIEIRAVGSEPKWSEIPINEGFLKPIRKKMGLL